MKNRPDELLKPIAYEYAKKIVEGSTDFERIKELRDKLGFTSIADTEFNNKEVEKDIRADGDYVGIWKKQNINGKEIYARDKKLGERFRFWADVQVIPEKTDKYRIAFLGESVARGYFYSPYFTPAKYLEETLSKNSDKKEYEVIDLARISIHIKELENLCEESMKLEPDALVIFAGNNWKYSLYPYTDEEVKKIIELEEADDRFEAIKKLLEDKYNEFIGSFLDRVNKITSKYNVPVVYVIPEFNLRDWKSTADDYILLWPNGTTSKWFDLKDKLEAAKKAENFDEIKNYAEEIIKLNPANPYGYEVLAETYKKQGLIDEAYKYYREVRDSSIYRRIYQPVTISTIENIINENSEKYNYKVVDLPKVFKGYLKDDIPGYNLFVDYCHMNEVGIQVSMKHLASEILKISENKEVEPEKIIGSQNLPDKKILSYVHFLAAIHCAHMCEQPYEILYYHCKKALEYRKEISECMKQYIDMVNTDNPWVFTKSAEYFFYLELTKQYPILYQPDDCAVMDIDLVNAMVDALKGEGILIEDEVRETRKKYFAPTDKKVDLMSTYYRELSYYYSQKASSYFSFSKRAFISSIDRKSRFYLIADNKNNIKLELTFRTPFKEEDNQYLEVLVNNEKVGTILAADKWKDLNMEVPKEILKEDGVNEVNIIWPYIDKVEKSLREENIKNYSGDDLIIRNSRLEYGDIFRFNAERN